MGMEGWSVWCTLRVDPKTVLALRRQSRLDEAHQRKRETQRFQQPQARLFRPPPPAGEIPLHPLPFASPYPPPPPPPQVELEEQAEKIAELTAAQAEPKAEREKALHDACMMFTRDHEGDTPQSLLSI